jgi:hypothetical protein
VELNVNENSGQNDRRLLTFSPASLFASQTSAKPGSAGPERQGDLSFFDRKPENKYSHQYCEENGYIGRFDAETSSGEPNRP